MQTSYSRQYVDLWRRHWWWQSRHDRVMRKVSSLVPRNSESSTRPQILDIGCCGGVMFDDLSNHGDVHGIEPDEGLVDAVPRWAGVVEQAFFGRDYESDRQYDLVLMLDVLEHIEDDVGALDSLRQLLVPGGAAIITVPALMSLWSAHDEANLHFRRYERPQLRRLLTSSGFNVRELHYFFGWPLPLMYARRLLAHSADDGYQVQVPPRPVNELFRALSTVERWLTSSTGVPAPLGSSLLAVVEPAAPDRAIASPALTGEMAHSSH